MGKGSGSSTRDVAAGMRRILVAMVVCSVLAPLTVAVDGRSEAEAATGAVNLLFTAGGDPARYGANQVVALEAGNINFVADCTSLVGGGGERPTPGVKDSFQPFADLYIVPAGSSFTNNAKLVDAAGVPNTVHGGLAGSFLYEPLGATKPIGNITSGTFGIVVDECQNGVFDTGEDSFIDDTFRVDVTQFVPSIGPELPAFFALKQRAARGATAIDDVETLIKLHTLFEQARNFQTAVQTISAEGVTTFILNQAVANFAFSNPYKDEARQLARATVTQHRLRLGRLAKDPPDADFARFAVPTAAGAHMETSTTDIGALWSEYLAHMDALSALTGSILDGVERYQGAADSGDALWAVRHARTVQDHAAAYELLLADFLVIADSLQLEVADEVADHGLGTFVADIDWVLDQMPDANLRTAYRLLNTGQDPDLGAAIVGQHQADLLGPVLNKNSEWQAILEEAELSVIDFGDALPAFRALMAGHETDLETTLGDDADAPDMTIAVTGTPSAGAEVTLDAVGLVGSAAVAWDLDGDGDVDDANGTSVPWTVPGDAIEGVPLIVSAVASGVGYQASAAHVVTVAPGGNEPPDVDPLATDVIEIAPGDSVPLTAVATDPDGDPLTYEWLVDGVLQPGEEAASFTFATTPTDFGGRWVEVLVSDGSALTRVGAFVVVTTVDADGDKYLAAPGPDCRETETPEGVDGDDINPGESEIVGNGADDDCDPSTPDDAGPLGAVNISNAPGSIAAGAIDSRTLSWSHPAKFSGDAFSLTFDWGDGSQDTATVSGTTVPELDFGDLDHQYRSQNLQTLLEACIVHVPSGDEFCDENDIAVVNNRPIVNAADLRTFGVVGLGYNYAGKVPSGDWEPLDPSGQRVISTGNPSNYVILPSDVPLPEGAGYGRVSYDQQVFSTGDDDWIGLVLGYQSGEHDDAAADFVAVTWGANLDKAGYLENTKTICNDASSSRQIHPTGYLQAARQHGLAIIGEIRENTIYSFPYDPTDDVADAEDPQDPRCDDAMGRVLLESGVAPLSGGLAWDHRADTDTELESTGWPPDSYLIEIDYQPDSLTVWIDGEEQFVATPGDPGDPFPPGGIGLYYSSQSSAQLAVTAPEPTFAFVQGKGGEFSSDPADGISVPMHDSPGDTHTIRIDWGDGTATTEGIRTPDPATGDGWYDITGVHVYERAGTNRGEVCVSDQHDAGMCFPFTAEVANVAPVVYAGEDRPADANVTLDDMTFQDPGRFDTHTATIDWGDGGGPEAATVTALHGGGIVSGSHTYAASGPMTVEVCVTDHHGDGACDQRELTVTADNLTPVAQSVASAEAPEGTPVVVPIGFTDGNVDDTHTASISWGDGTPDEPIAIQDGGDFGSGDGTHAYADNGIYSAVVEVCDQNAACHQVGVPITITNVEPAVDVDVILGVGPASLTATMTDPGVDDTHTATVDWGDGGGAQAVSVTPTGPDTAEVTDTHTFAALGTFVVEVCVTDDDGGVGCALTSVGIGVPGPPLDPSAIGGDAEADVRWESPTDDGGSVITEFEVETTPGGVLTPVVPPVLTKTVTGLANGVDHTFRVRARNTNGWGPWSVPSNVARPRAACAGAAFLDVAADHPFCPEIDWMGTNGVSSGWPDGTYRPIADVTRQAMAAFTYRLVNPGGDPPDCVVSPFTDVAISDAFCPEISWMKAEGITTGFADGTYRPGSPVTRQAMAAFFYRLSGSERGGDPACISDEFSDVLAAHPFCGEIDWMVDSGITGGFAERQLQTRPQDLPAGHGRVHIPIQHSRRTHPLAFGDLT